MEQAGEESDLYLEQRANRRKSDFASQRFQHLREVKGGSKEAESLLWEAASGNTKARSELADIYTKFAVIMSQSTQK